MWSCLSKVKNEWNAINLSSVHIFHGFGSLFDDTIDSGIEKDEKHGGKDVDEDDWFEHTDEGVNVGEPQFGWISPRDGGVAVDDLFCPELKEVGNVEDDGEDEDADDCHVPTFCRKVSR